ncbi:MAG: methionine adenosyltransferase, partial [Omnitrophica WOR_2 bacterium GWA2_53_43]
MKGKYYLTSESVGNGHPDKVCDQISDAVLDAVLRDDPQGRVACETFITTGLVVVGGEITTKTYVDVQKLVRRVLTEIGYTDHKYGFNASTCGILNVIVGQSPDIAQGVDTGGAGDQGIMIGYACDETPELMPLPIVLAHKLVQRVEEVRNNGTLKYLGPDCKSQVTVEYEDGTPRRVDAVVLACQHTEEILDKTGKRITEEARNEIIKTVAAPILGKLTDSQTKYYVNETGKFVVGGPQSDTGMTGRKIIVDTYGGVVSHGGGAFSGKDPTKVDRSATYMARYVAKNIVAAKLAHKCWIQFSYVIGRADPVSVMIDTFGTGKISE